MANKPTRISIGCPKHGSLHGPYKETLVRVGKSAINNVVCAYCESCGRYYSTALALCIGRAEPIGGVPVLQGKMIHQSSDDCYRNQPKIMTQMEQEKENVTTKKEQRNKQNRQRQTKYAEKTTRYDNTARVKYFVTNSPALSGNNICPTCNSKLTSTPYNIPCYYSDGNFKSYYIAMLSYCRNCHCHYMKYHDFVALTKRINSAPDKAHLKPQNMIHKFDHRSQQYLYEPIADSMVFAFSDSEGSGSFTDEFSGGMGMLHEKSFLGKEGYSTSVSLEKRREILYRTVKKYGRRKVADHLRFLISTRSAQSNGKQNYQKAIQTWKDDLNYVATIK